MYLPGILKGKQIELVPHSGRGGRNAIKLSRVGVQTFSFGRDWLR